MAIELIKATIENCSLCQMACNKKLPIGHGDILYVVPYDSDDVEILERRGVVIHEVACENGIDYACNIYVRSMISLVKKVVVTTSYASRLLGRQVENFERFKFQGATFIATNTPCDIRVRQELEDV